MYHLSLDSLTKYVSLHLSLIDKNERTQAEFWSYLGEVRFSESTMLNSGQNLDFLDSLPMFQACKSYSQRATGLNFPCSVYSP